jgi:ABC-type branched-subunit amino acid transport system ATPase component
MADRMILTEGLVKRYGRHPALQGLDLTVQPGEVFGYLGPNGAGKTTTIRLLLDLLRPTAGTVRLLGQDPRRRRPAALWHRLPARRAAPGRPPDRPGAAGLPRQPARRGAFLPHRRAGRAAAAAAFQRLPGVRAVAVDDEVLRCVVEGTADALVKAAAQFPVLSLLSHEPDLEEVFLAYYTEGSEPRAA